MMNPNKTTYDLNGETMDFRAEQLAAYQADYKAVVLSGDLKNEASLKHILLEAGFSDDYIRQLQVEALDGLDHPITFYKTRLWSQEPVVTLDHGGQIMTLLLTNLHVPFTSHVKEKKKSKKKDHIDDVNKVVKSNYWTDEPVAPKPASRATPGGEVKVLSDGYFHVHAPKSAIIHYAKDKATKTLCGKKNDRPVKQADLLDPLYTICEKCASKA